MNQTVNTTKRRVPWLWLLVSLGVIAVDQLTKWLCVAYLKPVGRVTLIPNFLKLTYVENRGAAFGSFTENRWVFMVISTVAIIGVTVYLLRYCEDNRLLRCALALIVGGGIGNMIDRVARGFVVDFIDVTCIDFYVFNVADSFVCVGCGLMILWLFLDEAAQRKAKKAAEEAPEVSEHEE